MCRILKLNFLGQAFRKVSCDKQTNRRYQKYYDDAKQVIIRRGPSWDGTIADPVAGDAYNGGFVLPVANLANSGFSICVVAIAGVMLLGQLIRRISAYVDLLLVARIKLMPGQFTDASTNDEKLRDMKLVFITALCSKSGVANPVSFVVTEGEGLYCCIFLIDAAITYMSLLRSCT